MNSHHDEVMKYCDDIKHNNILSGLYTKKAVNRFLSDLKRQKDEDFLYEFRPIQGDKIINFAEKLFIPDLNKNLTLLPWMKFIYYNLFGWVLKTDTTKRRFRTAYCEVARKNSKTTSLLFPIILYDFMYTPAAESFFVSKDGNQSSKVFLELKQIFINSFKYNTKEINITDSSIRKDTSFILFFSSESRGTDSYKNSCSVIDEYWDYDNNKVITSFRYGGRARKNNLSLIITSAGTNIDGPCYAENEKARKILNNVLTDDTYFTIIYAYDETDDWKDEKHFIKANPSLYTILDKNILLNDLHDAIITPSHVPDFKSKTCGVWQNATSNWIPLEKWDTDTRRLSVNEDVFVSESCYCGIDLSSVNDFTVYTKVFKKDHNYYFFHKFYIPEEQIKEKYKGDNINILEWTNNGIVIATPGSTIDYDYIFNDIMKDSEKFNIKEIAYDKWQSNKLIEKLETELGDNVVLIDFPQSLVRMSGPTKVYEKAIYDDTIIDSSPVMKWMITNATIKIDVNGNYKPLKEFKGKNSTKRIDGVITSIMCMDRCNQNEAPVILQSRDFNKVLNLFN
jgi:phage terminase large subunit-like protein